MQPVPEQELRWKCRRGMLELDILLNRFLDRRYAQLDAQQHGVLLRLLEYPDQVLHDMLVLGQPSSDAAIAQLVSAIRHAARPPSP